MTSVTSARAIHLGMDTSKDTIVVAVLLPGEELPAVDRIASREEAVRRLIARFGVRERLRACRDRRRQQNRCPGQGRRRPRGPRRHPRHRAG